MVNYNNGKIYKLEPIVEYDEGDIYIGSTTKYYLSQRIDTHRSYYLKWKKGIAKSYITSYGLFDKYGLDNCIIVLLENVNANTKDELLAREAHYIKSMKCINKVIPLRTRQEYKQDNKDKIIEYRKRNKEHIKLKNKEYRERNKEQIKLKNKEYCLRKKAVRQLDENEKVK